MPAASSSSNIDILRGELWIDNRRREKPVTVKIESSNGYARILWQATQPSASSGFPDQNHIAIQRSGKIDSIVALPQLRLIYTQRPRTPHSSGPEHFYGILIAKGSTHVNPTQDTQVITFRFPIADTTAYGFFRRVRSKFTANSTQYIRTQTWTVTGLQPGYLQPDILPSLLSSAIDDVGTATLYAKIVVKLPADEYKGSASQLWMPKLDLMNRINTKSLLKFSNLEQLQQYFGGKKALEDAPTKIGEQELQSSPCTPKAVTPPKPKGPEPPKVVTPPEVKDPEASKAIIPPEVKNSEASKTVTLPEAKSPEALKTVTPPEAKSPEALKTVTPPEAKSPEASKTVTPPEVKDPEASKAVIPPEVKDPEASKAVTPPEVKDPEASKAVTPPEVKDPEASKGQDFSALDAPAHIPVDPGTDAHQNNSIVLPPTSPGSDTYTLDDYSLAHPGTPPIGRPPSRAMSTDSELRRDLDDQVLSPNPTYPALRGLGPRRLSRAFSDYSDWERVQDESAEGPLDLEARSFSMIRTSGQPPPPESPKSQDSGK
ncbi:hypothetical protein TWF718_005314 [Orbilia javanica]|uniref:Uncharacterized protein n=1 Tax=Orbilia javanica TaxID=47235 RepID=A0AAN8RNT8_9PEZI